MKGMMIVTMALALSSCIVANRRGGGVEVVPILPLSVEVYDDNYYAHNGYHYFYVGDSWLYSTSYGGPRMSLPRSHWPKNTRRGNGRGRGHGKH